MIVRAIVSAGIDDNDSSAALKSALANPKVQHIAKSVLLSEATACLSCINILAYSNNRK
jgi:hypothetical protein